MMKRLLAFAVLCVALQSAYVGAAQGGSMPDVKVKWVFTAMNVADHPGVTTIRDMAARIKERTNGNWTIELYPAGILANEADAVEMTRAGTVNLIQTSVMFMELYMPEFGALGFPYLFRSWNDMHNFINNSEFMKEKWSTLEKSFGLRYVDCLYTGARDLVTKGVQRVRSPADLKGAKIRSQQPPSRQNMVASLGATPVPMSLEEVYIATQTGVIQGQENPIATIWINKFYEVTDDLYKTAHNYADMAYFVNAEGFDALPAEYKQVWHEEWGRMIDEFDVIFLAAEKESEENIRKHGVRIWTQDDMDMQAFYDSAADMIEKNYMGNPTFAAVVKAVRSFCGYE